MSKQHRNDPAPSNTVTTSAGAVVAVKPISAKLLEMFDLSHKAPEPPMVAAVAIGGSEELVPNPDDSEYQAALHEYNMRATEDFVNMILDLGTDVSLPSDGAWQKRVSRLGVSLPSDPDELRLVYIQIVLMPNYTSDLRDITAAVLRLSGVNEEAIASWVELFRR